MRLDWAEDREELACTGRRGSRAPPFTGGVATVVRTARAARAAAALHCGGGGEVGVGGESGVGGVGRWRGWRFR